MKEVSFPESGVFKIIPKEQFTSEMIWSILSEILPAKDCIFAEFSTAPGVFVWSLPGDDWLSLDTADESTRQAVMDIILAKKRAVAAALQDSPLLQKVDSLFTVPSDECRFYRPTPDGSFQVMLAAWDYKSLAHRGGSNVKIVIDPAKKLQDVVLKFIEAGKPVPGYSFLLKLFNGSMPQKKADAAGCFPMPGLVVGNRYTLFSLDKSRDFSFTVEDGKNEIVYDLTGDIRIEVQVNRDNAPAAGVPVQIAFSGLDYSLVTGPDGMAVQAVPYRTDAEAIVRVEGKLETVTAEYPVTRVEFDMHTPVASVAVDFFRNGKPVAAQSVFVRIPGRESLVLHTDAAGRASCRLPFREGAEVTVEAGSFADSKPFEMETYFRFDERVPIRFNPAIRVKNTDGGLEIRYPVFVETEGSRVEFQTDDTGMVDLRNALVGADLLIRDGKNPDNVRSYVLEEDVLVYEFTVPAPIIERYNISLVPTGDLLPEGLSLTLKQGTREFPLRKEEDGRFHIRKDDLVAGSAVKAVINKDGSEICNLDVVFDRNEDDYEITVKQKQKRAIGPVLKQVAVGLVTAAVIAAAFSAFVFFLL